MQSRDAEHSPVRCCRRARIAVVLAAACVVVVAAVLLKIPRRYEFRDPGFWQKHSLPTSLNGLALALEYAPAKVDGDDEDGGFSLLLTNTTLEPIDLRALLLTVNDGCLQTELLRGPEIQPGPSGWGEVARSMQERYFGLYSWSTDSIPVISPGRTFSAKMRFTAAGTHKQVPNRDIPEVLAYQGQFTWRSMEVSLYESTGERRAFLRQGRVYWAHRLPLACFALGGLDLTKNARLDPVGGYLAVTVPRVVDGSEAEKKEKDDAAGDQKR